MPPVPAVDLGAAADVVLVGRAIAGDARAFDVVKHRHDAVLRRAILRITRNAADVDEVPQETVLKVWQERSTTRRRSPTAS